MTRTQLLQELRRMRFQEAYGGWQERRLTQEVAARLLGGVSADSGAASTATGTRGSTGWSTSALAKSRRGAAGGVRRLPDRPRPAFWAWMRRTVTTPRDQAIAPRRGDGPLNVRTSHRTGANPGGRVDSTEDNVDALDTALPTLSRLSPTNFQGPATGDSGQRSDNPCAKRPYGSLCCQHPVFSVAAEVEMALR